MFTSLQKAKASGLSKFLAKRALWGNLKKLQNDRVVKATYVWLVIVPVATKFFSKLNNTIILPFGDEKLLFDLVLPFSWIILYLAALLFALASMLYSFFAPEIIKENDDFGDFKRAEKSELHLVDYMSKREVKYFEDENVGNPNCNCEGEFNLYGIFHVIVPEKDNYQAEQIRLKERLKKHFGTVFDRRNLERERLRISLILILGVSFFLLLYVLLQNIWYVAGYALS